jgi:hypothetical protein
MCTDLSSYDMLRSQLHRKGEKEKRYAVKAEKE